MLDLCLFFLIYGALCLQYCRAALLIIEFIIGLVSFLLAASPLKCSKCFIDITEMKQSPQTATYVDGRQSKRKRAGVPEHISSPLLNTTLISVARFHQLCDPPHAPS